MFNNYDESQDVESTADEIMFRLIRANEDFSKDDFYKLAREQSMPPRFMQELAVEKFLEFERVGYIKRTKDGSWREVAKED